MSDRELIEKIIEDGITLAVQDHDDLSEGDCFAPSNWGGCDSETTDGCYCRQITHDNRKRILSDIEEYGFVVAQGWQPISTAPKDGTVVLVDADVPHRIRMAYFGMTRTREASWFVYNGMPFPALDQPTTWMPLPKTPNEQEGDQ